MILYFIGLILCGLCWYLTCYRTYAKVFEGRGEKYQKLHVINILKIIFLLICFVPILNLIVSVIGASLLIWGCIIESLKIDNWLFK